MTPSTGRVGDSLMIFETTSRGGLYEAQHHQGRDGLVSRFDRSVLSVNWMAPLSSVSLILSFKIHDDALAVFAIPFTVCSTVAFGRDTLSSSFELSDERMTRAVAGYARDADQHEEQFPLMFVHEAE